MRLHDVQVVLSQTNTADRVQQVNQQQGQVAQNQNAALLEKQSQVKPTQTQQADNEAPSRFIQDKEKRGSAFKKNEKNRDAANDKSLQEPEITKLPVTPTGNIIDIKI